MIVVRLLAVLSIAAAGAAFLFALPDIVRYYRMRSM